VLHYTFDEYEGNLEKMYKHIESEIQAALKDATYYNRPTLLLVCRLRDSLKVAYETDKRLNKA